MDQRIKAGDAGADKYGNRREYASGSNAKRDRLTHLEI
jgi:hypothetical protein